MPKVTIEELATIDDYLAVEELQLSIWNDARNVASKELMVAVRTSGGLVAGARRAGRLVGFVLGIPTADPTVQHSRKLGVLPEVRSTGTAARLKHFQRDWCLERGLRQVVWTFDPLKGPNVNFNLHKLGATAHEYFRDHYGPMGGIDAGAPSDRVLARWDLASAVPGGDRLQGGSTPDAVAGRWANRAEDGEPVGVELSLDTPTVYVQIPEDWDATRTRSKASAKRWRSHSREVFEAYYARGYVSVDFRRGPNAHVLVPAGSSSARP
jgi:chorismate synthase